jgi:uncharacterized protein (TIGR00255 family)
MTGFGRGEAPYGDGGIVVEVTTVNSRHLDVTVRGLREYGSLELDVRSLVGERLGRGKAHVTVAVRGTSAGTKRVVSHVDLAREYVNEFERLRYAVGLKGNLPLEALTSRDDFLTIEEDTDDGALADGVLAALDAALGRVSQMRAAEGEKLAADLSERLERLGKLYDDVASRAPEVAAAYRDRLQARISELTDGAGLDPGRLENETALFAERCDISEEIVRSRAHVKAFADALGGDGRAGRRLDFLAVELNREANTIAAKAQDAGIASLAIGIKDLLEQIREQVQNIE